MAGTIIDSELNTERGQPCPREPVYSDRADKAVRAPHASVRFRLAELSDDHAIRELLRTNPTPGAISLSFEREPNFFSTMGLAGADDQTILAFDLDRLVCMGRCSVRRRYLNGVPKRVGYLADLRLDKSAEGRFDMNAGMRVDAQHAGLDALCDSKRPANVARPERAAQPI